MTVSTNGQIAYGIVFDEGYEFPWSAEESEDDIQDWWRRVNGFKQSFELFDAEGNFINGVEDKTKTSAYFDEQREFDKARPLPVELVNYCSCDCPMYMLAVPNVGETARRGYPEKFKPEALSVSPKQHQALMDFIKKYIPECDEEPGWYLTSLWC